MSFWRISRVLNSWSPQGRSIRKWKKVDVKGESPIYVRMKIDRALVDLGRHHDLIQAKDGTATPAAVKASYMALPVAQKMVIGPNWVFLLISLT